MKPYQTPESDRMTNIARKIIPSAMMSNFRRAVISRTIYMDHGNGARLYDIDGNEYIDYSLGFGPDLLGHSNDHMRDVLYRQVNKLHTSNVCELEVTAAQKVVDHIASAELVRFACSGTESNRAALRVARALTGRDLYVRFNGHYHGGLDHIMGGIVTNPDDPIPVQGEFEDDIYSRFTNTDGRYSGSFNQVYMLEWNDLSVLKKLLQKQGEKIAALIMEPVMVNNFGCLPEPGYLEGVRELCSTYGIILIFDEVLTGFRIALKGAQGYFGVTPDMTTLAKSLGGGFPVSSFCGKRSVMDAISRGDVVQGGTYNGHPLAMAAVIAAIEEYERDDGAIYQHIEKLGTALKLGLDQIAQEQEQPLLLQGFPGAWTFTFTKKKRIKNHTEGRGSDFDKSLLFGKLLKEYGVITSLRFCTSAAHSEKDIGDTLDRANEVMKILKEKDAKK